MRKKSREDPKEDSCVAGTKPRKMRIIGIKSQEEANNRLSVCNTMDKKIVLLVLLGLIVASSEALFFGVPRSPCRYDNQCRLRKCVNRGNIFCGAGSK